MQLNHKISIVTAAVLFSSNLQAEDYVRVNYMQYTENDSRIQVQAPSIEVNKDFGVDYTLNAKLIGDSVSGGTPIYSDTTSGASAFNRGIGVDATKVKKENVDMSESRAFASASLVKRLQNRDEITTSYSKSYESDYDSNTLSVDYLTYSDNTKNRSYNFGLSYRFDTVLVKECSSENYICDSTSGASAKENVNALSTEVGLTQIIDSTSLAKLSLFYSNEDGYLSNPYYNVVRNNNGVTADVVAEKRPETRVSTGFNIKYIKSLSDKLSLNVKYKFYNDDWDITSHTIDLNNYYELNESIILGFGLRYYTQSEAKFYNESIKYFTNEEYASHDDRLSNFDAITYKGSIEYKYNDKISYNGSINLYDQSTDLSATYFSVGFKYSF